MSIYDMSIMIQILTLQGPPIGTSIPVQCHPSFVYHDQVRRNSENCPDSMSAGNRTW